MLIVFFFFSNKESHENKNAKKNETNATRGGGGDGTVQDASQRQKMTAVSEVRKEKRGIIFSWTLLGIFFFFFSFVFYFSHVEIAT